MTAWWKVRGGKTLNKELDFDDGIVEGKPGGSLNKELNIR